MSLRPEDAATLQAYFEGVDHAREEIDAKWGVGRIFRLIDEELRAKFYRQQAAWSAALQAAWAAPFLSGDMLADVAKKAGAMKRGFAALDAAAEEAGHRPIFPDVWEARLADGTVAAIVRTDAEASKVIADGRHLVVYTLAEVAHVIDALPTAIQAAKKVFPGATVLGPPDRTWVRNGDEIPF